MDSQQEPADDVQLLSRCRRRLIFGSLLVIALLGFAPPSWVATFSGLFKVAAKPSPPSPAPKPDAPSEPREPSEPATAFPTPAARNNSAHSELLFRFDHCDAEVVSALVNAGGPDLRLRLQGASRVIACQKAAIEEHYDDPQLFEDAMTFYGDGAAEAALVGKFKAAFSLGRDFVMALGGTSVTAGHDNLFSESWPEVVRLALQGAFAAAGAPLVVRNVAVGNNPPVPYSFCLANHAGTDADIVGWEMGISMLHQRSHFEMIEIYMRSALRFPKRPALLVVGRGGARNPETGRNQGKPLQPQTGPRKESKTLKLMHGPDSQLPMEYYSQYGAHFLDPEAIFYTRDTRDPFRFTVDNEMKATPHPRNWHPGPLSHQHFGLTLSFHYLRLMQRAVEELLADATLAPPAADDSELIPAADCRESPTCKLPVACAMSYLPRYGAPALEELVVDGATAGWVTELYPSDIKGVARAESYHAQYHDAKTALKIPSPDAGWLAFHFTSSAAGPVAVCQPAANFNQVPRSCGRMPQDAAFRVDGAAVEPPKDQKNASYLMSGGGKRAPLCVVLMKNLPAGAHTIEVSSKRKAIYVSHLLWME